MSTSSPNVLELSEHHPYLLPVLKEYKLSLTEFGVLALCVRDDERHKFALSDFQAKQSDARLEAVHSLEIKGLILRSPTTQRWELTTAGIIVWQIIPLLVQGYEPATKKAPATVSFIRCGTSA